jgi:biopolymer transport protein ExbD
MVGKLAIRLMAISVLALSVTGLSACTTTRQPPKEIQPANLWAVWISASGDIYVKGELVADDKFIEALENAVGSPKSDPRIMVRAEKGAPYSKVIELMNRLQSAGFTKIALITEEIV